MTKSQSIVRNGFTLIATRWVDRAQAIAILGHREDDYGHEYVTSWMGSLEDDSWSQGHYTRDLSTAADAFKSMTGGS
jgi:hypothetical protein